MVASGTGSEEPEYECISWFIIIVRHPSFILLLFLFLFLLLFFFFFSTLPLLVHLPLGNVDFSHDEQLSRKYGPLITILESPDPPTRGQVSPKPTDNRLTSIRTSERALERVSSYMSGRRYFSYLLPMIGYGNLYTAAPLLYISPSYSSRLSSYFSRLPHRTSLARPASTYRTVPTLPRSPRLG